MSPLETLGFALGTSFASGLNVYATVAAAGIMQRLGVVHLPETLQVLAHPIVLGLAGTLFIVEFIADKIPYVDSAWDAVHTFIRPPAAAVLSYSAFGNVPEEWKLGAALLAGIGAPVGHGHYCGAAHDPGGTSYPEALEIRTPYRRPSALQTSRPANTS